MFFTTPKENVELKILNSFRCGILSVSLDKRITAINEIAMRILELEDKDYIGSNMEVVFHNQEQLLQILRDACQMRNLPSRAEMELKVKEGSERTVGYTLSFIRNDEDKIEGISLFFKDLTLVEQMNEQEKLKDRLAALGQMAAGLAHEIRNPLAAIELTTSLIKRKLSDQPAFTAQLEKVNSEVKKLNKIVSDCLEFVRPVKVSAGKVELPELLDESLASALSVVSREGITVRKEYLPTPSVSLDLSQMKQVFVNILMNALQAVGDSGTVSISCGPSTLYHKNSRYPRGKTAETNLTLQVNLAPYAWIKISDDGCGIPEEVLGKIFYPFFTTKERGSGIGLAIAQKIIDSHRGSIDVESEIGRGTTFTIKLPLLP
ncbi:MAG TPA: ATP-binding protein [Terriglobia bacterium]|nr:ATP-binding protein [Terriglobia bacterium]